MRKQEFFIDNGEILSIVVEVSNYPSDSFVQTLQKELEGIVGSKLDNVDIEEVDSNNYCISFFKKG